MCDSANSCQLPHCDTSASTKYFRCDHLLCDDCYGSWTGTGRTAPCPLCRAERVDSASSGVSSGGSSDVIDLSEETSDEDLINVRFRRTSADFRRMRRALRRSRGQDVDRRRWRGARRELFPVAPVAPVASPMASRVAPVGNDGIVTSRGELRAFLQQYLETFRRPVANWGGTITEVRMVGTPTFLADQMVQQFNQQQRQTGHTRAAAVRPLTQQEITHIQ